MNKLDITRLLKFNRFLSWIFAIVATIQIISGYGITRNFISRFSSLYFFNREIHIWVDWVFIGLLFFHVFVTEAFINFNWRFLWKSILNRKITSYLFLKLIQKTTAYIILANSLLIILSGLDWHWPKIISFIRLNDHLRFDLYLIIALIIHLNIGVKMALLRRRTQNKWINITLLFTSILFVTFIILIDYNIIRFRA